MISVTGFRSVGFIPDPVMSRSELVRLTGSDVITGSDPNIPLFSLIIIISFSVIVLFCNR